MNPGALLVYCCWQICSLFLGFHYYYIGQLCLAPQDPAIMYKETKPMQKFKDLLASSGHWWMHIIR